MKVSMSNKEYSKVRKHFKTMFKYGELTKEVCESEEYLNFEKEENKRKEARAFVKDYLTTMNENPYILDIRKKIDIYDARYRTIFKNGTELEKEVRELFKNKKIDRVTLNDFYTIRFFDFYTPFRNIGFSINNKVKNYNYESFSLDKLHYKEDVEEILCKFRRLVCDFSVALKEAKNKVESIKAQVSTLSKKRKAEDSDIEAQRIAKQIEEEKFNKEKKIKKDNLDAKHMAEAIAMELEHNFSNYRYYQDKKSR